MKMEPKPRRFPVLDEAVKAMGSIARFARDAGIGEQTYYKIQDGTNDPTLFTIRRCLEYTGLTFEEAFQEKERRPVSATHRTSRR